MNYKSKIITPIKKVLRCIKILKSREARISTSPFYTTFPPKLAVLMINSRINISKEFNYAYFRIPKAANTTIIATLYHAETGKLITTNEEINYAKLRYYSHPDSLNFEQLADFLDHCYKFTFVRNPYSRLLSAYHQKIRSNKQRIRDDVTIFLNKPTGSDISLSEFLDYLEEGGIMQNAHWACQSELLVMPVEKFDFIGKIEHLGDDLSFVMKNIYHSDKPIISKTGHATKSSEKIYELDSETLFRIYSLYKKDFDIFNYPKAI